VPGASVVAQLVRLVELLTTGAIEATIGALVDITALEASGPKAFDAGPVTEVGAGPDEIVEGQIEALPDRPKAGPRCAPPAPQPERVLDRPPEHS
jgi:hypothetical protein